MPVVGNHSPNSHQEVADAMVNLLLTGSPSTSAPNRKKEVDQNKITNKKMQHADLAKTTFLNEVSAAHA